MEEFEALLNESLEIDTPDEGSVVKGRVIARVIHFKGIRPLEPQVNGGNIIPVAEGVRLVRGTSTNQPANVDHVLVTAATAVPTSAAILSRDS